MSTNTDGVGKREGRGLVKNAPENVYTDRARERE